jgi:hypothetical protein
MRHETGFAGERLLQRTLPDAPLAMPKQLLEQRAPWLDWLRLIVLVAAGRI